MKRYIQNIISSFINKVIVHYKHQKAKERIVRYSDGRTFCYRKVSIVPYRICFG